MALRSFLLAVLPVGIEVVQGQGNRVPQPVGPDFVVVTPIGRQRLSTNVESYADCAFFGSAVGTTLTVSPRVLGQIVLGSALFGIGVTAGTTISAQISGHPGGQGAYTLSAPLSGSNPMGLFACGAADIAQPTQITVQVDVYGPNAGDNTQTITTLFRDDYAALWFVRQGYTALAPLYAGDPRQMPFRDGEQQFEDRWSIDAVLQVNQVISPPTEFAGAIGITTRPVDAGLFEG